MKTSIINVNLDTGTFGGPVDEFNTNLRRPWRGQKDPSKAYVAVLDGVNADGTPKYKSVCVGNTTTGTLTKDEWQVIDGAIIEVAHRRMNLINLLESRGCAINLANGLGVTEFEWQTISDLDGASLDMDGLKQDGTDKLVYGLDSICLPIISKNWRLNLRHLESSRRKGVGLDTLLAREVARVVADYAENMLVNGTSTFTHGTGSPIYGLLDYPGAITGSLTADWSLAGTTGATILADIQSMLEDAAAVNHHGPFILIVPTRYETKLSDDFKAESDITIRERILKLSKISDIVVSDFFGSSTNKVVLFEPVMENVAIINGMPLRDFEWQSLGGWVTEHKVATIKVPLFRTDFRSQIGLVRYAL